MPIVSQMYMTLCICMIDRNLKINFNLLTFTGISMANMLKACVPIDFIMAYNEIVCG